LLAGLLAGAGATLVNLLVTGIARALFPIPLAFRPFMPLPILTACLGGALGAAGVYSVLERTTRYPQRTLALAALVALMLSFLLPVFLLPEASSSSPDVSPQILATLMFMHVNVAWLSVRALQSLVHPE
jgi:hypothetical protein